MSKYFSDKLYGYDVLHNSSKKTQAEIKRMVNEFTSYSTKSKEERERIQVNMDLLAGKWDSLTQKARQNATINVGGETIDISGSPLLHFPVIDIYAKKILGEFIMNPLTYGIKDLSEKGVNKRKLFRIEKVKQFFVETEINPAREAIAMQYMKEYGIEDPYMLNPDQQVEMEQQVNKRLEQQLPEYVKEAMEKYNTPEEQISMAIMNYIIKDQKVKFKFDGGAEFAVALSEEYYMPIYVNNQVKLYGLSPDRVTWAGSTGTEFCQDGVFAIHEKHLMAEDVIEKYGTMIPYDKLKKIIKTADAGHYAKYDKDKTHLNAIESREVALMEQHVDYVDNINMLEREGQQKYLHLLKGLNTGVGIKESFVSYKWSRPVVVVKRLINGKMKELIYADHYEMNPETDISVKKGVIPQVWNAISLGEANDYIFAEPKKFQYRRFSDPSPKLSIFGGKLESYQGETENSSYIDRGKPYQYRINVLMKKMGDSEDRDLGKILSVYLDRKPNNLSTGQYLRSIFVHRIALHSTKKEAQTPGVTNKAIESIDASTISDSSNYISKLDWAEQKMAQAMNQGNQNISQYATNQNIQNSIGNTNAQNYRMFNMRKRIREDVLNELLRIGLFAFKEDDYLRSMILSDFEDAYLQLNMEDFDPHSMALFSEDSIDEANKVKEYRSYALELLQGGMSGRTLSRIMAADSMAEIDDILYADDKKKEKQAEMDHSRAMEVEKERRETVQKQIEMANAFKSDQSERDRRLKLAMQKIDQDKFRIANDVDRNNLSDEIQAKMIEVEMEEKIAIENNRTKERIATQKNETDKEIEKMKQKSRPQ